MDLVARSFKNRTELEFYLRECEPNTVDFHDSLSIPYNLNLYFRDRVFSTLNDFLLSQLVHLNKSLTQCESIRVNQIIYKIRYLFKFVNDSIDLNTSFGQMRDKIKDQLIKSDVILQYKLKTDNQRELPHFSILGRYSDPENNRDKYYTIERKQGDHEIVDYMPGSGIGLIDLLDDEKKSDEKLTDHNFDSLEIFVYE